MATWKFRQAWGALLLGLVSLLLLAADARAGCETDMECKGDRICRDGECVDADENGTAEPTPAPSTTTGTIRVHSTAPGTVHLNIGARWAGKWGQVGKVEREPLQIEGVAVGSHEVKIETEDGATDSQLVTVMAGRTAEVHLAPDRYQNEDAMIAGVVLVSAGAVATTFGVIVAGGATNGRHPPPGPEEVWVPLLVGGGAGLVAGVVCLVIGAPLVEADAALATEDVSVEPLIGPTGGGLRVRF